MSDSGLGGGDSDDGVIELRIEEVEDESSSSRKADTRGRLEVGGQISSSLSESSVIQSTAFSDDLREGERRLLNLKKYRFYLQFRPAVGPHL